MTTIPAIADDATDWKTLSQRKAEILKRLPELQQQFRNATEPAQREKIVDEFNMLRDEFQKQVYPQLAALAEKIYASDPMNFDAGETALEAAFQSNRYDTAVKVGDQLLTAGRNSALVQNLTGVSHFATHDFAQAEQILKVAQQANQLSPRLGAPYLEASSTYQKLWEREQAIRQKEALLTGEDALPRVLFKTTQGEILIELFENEAPNTVANFISLTESKQYDGVKFHRVIPNFMAQGGDPLSKDDDPENDGTGGPGYTIACECYRPDARMHFRGSLSMAHAGKNTGGSQFFLTHLPTSHLNPNPEAGSGHTVFGRVVEGLDHAAALKVGDTIQSATVIRKRNHPYQPVTTKE